MQPRLPDVSAADVLAHLAEGSMLLDVREVHEWMAGHAPQAVHISLSALPNRANDLPKDVEILCICHVGARSAAAAEALNRAGWNARNVAGGMLAWEAAGLAVVNDDGNPGFIA